MKTTPTAHNEDYKFNPKAAWPGSLALIGQAFRAVRDKPDFAYIFVGILGVFALAGYLVEPTSFFSFNLTSDSKQGNSSLIITALAALVSFALTGPLTLYQLRLADGRKVSVRQVFKAGLLRIVEFFALNIILIVCVFLGLLLLIVPGIIIGLRLIVANYVFFDKKFGPIEAIKQSFEMTRGHLGEIAGYVGIIILLSLTAGIISLFVPVFGNMAANAITVVYGVVGAWLYRWLTKQ